MKKIAALRFRGQPVWRSRGGLKGWLWWPWPGTGMPPGCCSFDSFSQTNTASKSIQLPQICLKKENILPPPEICSTLMRKQFDILLSCSHWDCKHEKQRKNNCWQSNTWMPQNWGRLCSASSLLWFVFSKSNIWNVLRDSRRFWSLTK